MNIATIKKMHAAKAAKRESLNGGPLRLERDIINPDEILPMKLSNVDSAWIAAMIDAEACIGIGCNSQARTPAYHLRMTIGNTSKALLERVEEIAGGKMYYKANVTGNRKPQWTWCLSGRESKRLLKRIAPLLIAKRAQAELALIFPINSSKCPHLRKHIYERMGLLNKRGK